MKDVFQIDHRADCDTLGCEEPAVSMIEDGTFLCEGCLAALVEARLDEDGEGLRN